MSLPAVIDFVIFQALDFSSRLFLFFVVSFGTRVFAARRRQGSGCKSRAAAQL
jgi:hypothetical protein